MKIQIYQILHVLSVILLVGLTFSAFAAPRKERKRSLLMATGILSVIVLVTGFGMISAIHGNHFYGWMIVKMVVWLGIAALGGVVFRQPGKAGLFGWITAVLVLIAAYMVYVRPF